MKLHMEVVHTLQPELQTVLIVIAGALVIVALTSIIKLLKG